jgi:chromate transporter
MKKRPIRIIEPQVVIRRPATIGGPSRFRVWLRLFWIFLKVNLMTTAGPTSVGLLYKETVGTIMNEARFVEAVGFSNLVPGSEALKLAMFVGYSTGGFPGMLAALLGAILPPAVIMLTVASILVRFQGEEWMKHFIRGMSPAVGVLMAIVSWQLFRSGRSKGFPWRTVLLAALSFIVLGLGVSPQFVLVGAGVLGILLFR